jgi:ribosomal subunit interface protein
MHIDIVTKNIALTDALRDRVTSELEKLEKVIPTDTRVFVEIGKVSHHHKQGEVYKAEGKITTAEANYFADMISEDLYTSIGNLGNELFNQVTEKKSRRRDMVRKGQALIKKLLRLS